LLHISSVRLWGKMWKGR